VCEFLWVVCCSILLPMVVLVVVMTLVVVVASTWGLLASLLYTTLGPEAVR